MRDAPKSVYSKWVVGCLERGKLFAESANKLHMRELLSKYPCLESDGYALHNTYVWTGKKEKEGEENEAYNYVASD